MITNLDEVAPITIYLPGWSGLPQSLPVATGGAKARNQVYLVVVLFAAIIVTGEVDLYVLALLIVSVRTRIASSVVGIPCVV